MTGRGAAATMNAVLWGSGYLYSRRGANGFLILLAHLALYSWAVILGLQALLLWAPILILGTLFFAIDGYKYAGPTRSKPIERVGTNKQKGFCPECGASVSSTVKFCPECGAKQRDS